MIDKNAVFDLVGKNLALWCGTDMDATDLADAVHFANSHNRSGHASILLILLNK